MLNKNRYKLIVLCLTTLLGANIFAQKSIPVIKANSTSVNVRDGKDFK